MWIDINFLTVDWISKPFSQKRSLLCVLEPVEVIFQNRLISSSKKESDASIPHASLKVPFSFLKNRFTNQEFDYLNNLNYLNE